MHAITPQSVKLGQSESELDPLSTGLNVSLKVMLVTVHHLVQGTVGHQSASGYKIRRCFLKSNRVTSVYVVSLSTSLVFNSQR